VPQSCMHSSQTKRMHEGESTGGPKAQNWKVGFCHIGGIHEDLKPYVGLVFHDLGNHKESLGLASPDLLAHSQPLVFNRVGEV